MSAHYSHTHHGGIGHPLDKDTDLSREDPETAEMEIENAYGFDAAVALNKPVVDWTPQRGPEYNTHTKLATLTGELDAFMSMSSGWRMHPRDTLDHIECKLQKLTITICTPTPMEPLKEVIQHYTNTLCTAQKQTNMTTSLLQDIPVFHGHDATWLEDWLADVETTADLTNESRANLAKAKSRGLTDTLITEAITLNKSWEDIKDFLWLKLCNTDIPAYISGFMEIQQGENESLTAYIHPFKMEARKCNFTNSAATI